LEEIFWRDARPGGEQPVKMKRAQPDVLGQSGQVRLLGVAFIQVPDDAGNSFIIVHAANLSLKSHRAHPVLAANYR